jgi:hypothetical protein
VGAAEPLSGWQTPASDERLEGDSAPPTPQKLDVKDAWLGLLLTIRINGDAIPALLHVLRRLYLLAALRTATARGTLPDC